MSSDALDRWLTPALVVVLTLTTALTVQRARANGHAARVLALVGSPGPAGDPGPGPGGAPAVAPGGDPSNTTPTTRPHDGAAPPAGSPLFEEAAAARGLHFVHRRGHPGSFWLPELIGAGGALVDLDGDGALDLYLVQGGPLPPDENTERNALYRNTGGGHFVDVGEASGADVPGHGLGAAAGDPDGDGDLDLLVTRLGSDVLLRNDGALRFHDVTAGADLGLPAFTTSALFVDLDGDGLQDLYRTGYAAWSRDQEQPCYNRSGARDACNVLHYPAADDSVSRNLGGLRFADVTEAWGVTGDRRHGLACLASDLDEDGHPELYVANDQSPAFLWEWDPASATLRDQATLRGAAYTGEGRAIAGMGVAAGDVDGDGRLDLLVSEIVSGHHLALGNGGPVLDDMSRRWGLGWSRPDTGWGLALFDQDHDGDLDLYVANGHVNLATEPHDPEDPFAQRDRFAPWTGQGFQALSPSGRPWLERAAVSRAVLPGDVDDDGDVDLVVTANGGPVRLLLNTTLDAGDPTPRDARHWASLDVRDARGAPALGARVELSTTEGRHVAEVHLGAAYAGARDPRVHVGLGRATEIRSLTVRWPDGTELVATDLPVDRRLRARPTPSGPVLDVLEP